MSMMDAMIERLEERARNAKTYVILREKHPEVPAAKVWGWMHSDGGESLAEYLCPGHRWICTGSAYGGDDDSYMGEGRVYCSLCGKDGDA